MALYVAGLFCNSLNPLAKQMALKEARGQKENSWPQRDVATNPIQ